MNGLLPNGHYFTIHITPEPNFSYVSFETNVSYDQYQEITEKILKMFNPGKFTKTIFRCTVTKKVLFLFFLHYVPVNFSLTTGNIKS